MFGGMLQMPLYRGCTDALNRTLDQYYYHMLASTKQRDKDQVVTRWAKSECQETHNILMVDQLWLWLFRAEDDTDIIISSFPDRTGFDSRDTRSMRSMDKLRDLVLDPIGHMRDPIQSTAGLVFRILATCSNIFDRCQEFKMLQFLQAFEISIGKVVGLSYNRSSKFNADCPSRATRKHRCLRSFKSGRQSYMRLAKSTRTSRTGRGTYWNSY